MKNIRKEDCTMKQWKKLLPALLSLALLVSCGPKRPGLTGCGNNTNNTDDNAVNEVEDGVEDGVDDIVDDLDPDDTEKNDTGKNDTDNTR